MVQPQGRREQILDAARQLVAERGARALSVRGVAARAGVGASTLRHYFPTQRELYDAVVGSLLDAQLDDLRITATEVPPQERLTECMAQFLPPDPESLPQLEAWVAAYLGAVGPGRSQQQELVLGTLATRGRRRVRGWLATLEAEGLLPGTDLDRAALFLLAVVDGLSLDLVAPGSQTSPEVARAVLADAVGAVVSGAVAGRGLRP